MVCRRREVDPGVVDMLRQIAAKLEAVETAQRRGRHSEDMIDDVLNKSNN